MHVHNNQSYLLQHSESFEIWSAIISINTKGKILDYEVGPRTIVY